MDIKEFSTLIKEKAKELDDMAKHRLPVKIGRMAKDHYQDNFRKGGFVNKSLPQKGNKAGTHRLLLITDRYSAGGTISSALSSTCLPTIMSGWQMMSPMPPYTTMGEKRIRP
mgnify:CR=1 FL=1